MSRRLSPGDAVSEVTARRLSIYLRGLQQLEADGVRTISSHDFARRFHLNSAQIRKDLATFGEFGIRGVGYDVGSLRRHIVGLLGIDSDKRVILCGAGHLGQALAGYGGFNSAGFRVVALFDVDPAKIGKTIHGNLPILDGASLPAFLSGNPVDIAVVAVPPEAAQPTTDTLVAAGVRAILNFSPVRLKAPESVFVKNVDLKIHLETLSFYLRNA
ncbi:MAG TPA: redox-sensing transcriptional repressor Rex [Thermoanaerobaculia bacterium]|jgi:redox-sensing transcriptional repressor|nr:redox-sensing transcriptional repressor Rex [Thermoanaerobaculia bacterium]